ncbi:pentapeptide repeat-containing protein [Mucilaginibacter sp. McL0603]|uniref:pentapeptide repeat-containing protein n=1 Tax=Mucilaginibacter sp. McL0603 TaxID=3415670 RepID=UPI003CF9B8F3
METIEINEDCKILLVTRAMLNDSRFQDVAMMNVKIIDANLSDLEIEGAQLGGAYIHNIGMPPKGHPMYDVNASQRPLRFENCDLHNSTITNCNLSGVVLRDCNISGMIINGIPVDKLLSEYEKTKK